jgi:ABC-type transport system involved in multi-copper enzyme maturation permease subunit
MGQFTSLTVLFLKQLLRRKSLWIVVAVFGAMALVNYVVYKQMQDALGQGASYDVATRQATSALTGFAGQIRGFSIALVLLVSALVAPAARKDGTAQFVLCLSVDRFRLAAAQFAALSAFVVAAVLVVHGGYVLAASRLGAMSTMELLAAWSTLLAPLLLASLVVFSLSLSSGAITVYGVLIGMPYLLLPLLGGVIGQSHAHLPMAMTRLIDNVRLLFPKAEDMIVWPHLGLDVQATEPPFPRWAWDLAHHGFASAFWIALGLWRYRSLDLGSRTSTK